MQCYKVPRLQHLTKVVIILVHFQLILCLYLATEWHCLLYATYEVVNIYMLHMQCCKCAENVVSIKSGIIPWIDAALNTCLFNAPVCAFAVKAKVKIGITCLNSSVIKV